MRPPISTYSIAARCARTGQLGVAAQSHHFAVGAVVTWARAGVGVVATQGFAEAGYGHSGLERMASGLSAAKALAALRDDDPGAALRQVAMVDAAGGVAVHTGAASVPVAGELTGAGYSVQGNMLASASVLEAMSAAYDGASGSLADRLLAALDAAEREGGDVRGRNSAALLVVSGERSASPWQGRLADARVDAHPEPLVELRRLVALCHAYGRLDEAQAAFARGDLATALECADEARGLAPGEPELPFWTAVALANAGRVGEAEVLLREVFARGEGFRELAARLARMGMLPPHLGVLSQ